MIRASLPYSLRLSVPIFLALLTSCGDPEPPRANAALQLQLGGAGCPVATQTLIAPQQSPFSGGGVAFADISRTAVESVTCRVADGGNGIFNFEGTFTTLLTSGARITLEVSNGSANEPANAGTTDLDVQASQPLFALQSTQPCTLTVNAVVPGGIFTDFSCTELSDPLRPGSSCNASGAFIFNDCSR